MAKNFDLFGLLIFGGGGTVYFGTTWGWQSTSFFIVVAFIIAIATYYMSRRDQIRNDKSIGNFLSNSVIFALVALVVLGGEKILSGEVTIQGLFTSTVTGESDLFDGILAVVVLFTAIAGLTVILSQTQIFGKWKPIPTNPRRRRP